MKFLDMFCMVLVVCFAAVAVVESAAIQSLLFQHLLAAAPSSPTEPVLPLLELNELHHEVKLALDSLHSASDAVAPQLAQETNQQEPLSEEAETAINQETLNYWFVLHDVDMDDRLDGNELLGVFSAWGSHEDNLELLSGGFKGEGDKTDNDRHVSGKAKKKILKSLTQMVDHMLQEHDLNNDGYLNISEFVHSQLQ